MTLDEIAKLALEADETRDDTALNEALCQAIATADAETIWAMLTVPGGGDIHGDGQLPTVVVAAIVARGLATMDARVLATAVRMSHFHCARLIAGDISKELGQRALRDAQDTMRGVWDDADPRLRMTILHALAASDTMRVEDIERLGALLRSDDVEVRALGLMIHAAVGGPDRDVLLDAHLDHESPLVRLMAAISLAREGGARPLTERTIAALRAAYDEPTPLPAWWVFQWVDGPETANDLAERMLEGAGVAVLPSDDAAQETSVEPPELPRGADAWRAYVWGEMSHDDAMAALTALPPSDRLVVSCADQRDGWYGIGTPDFRDEHYTRDYALMIAAMRTLDAGDFDLAQAVQSHFPNPTGVDLLPLTIAALLVMAKSELVLSDEDWERLADGFDKSSGHPAVEAILQETSAAARQRIEDILF